MSPSSGHVLVPKAVKAFKYMVSKGAAYVRARLSQELGAAKRLEAIPVRIAQPLHPVAALRQRIQHRSFSTAIRRIIADVARPAQAARPYAGSTIRSAVSRGNSAPFSSPLRPNLTGGAIPRSSGGYTLGGQGVRHFSSTPFAQAHVVQNVSAAVRAFCVNGYKVDYDGLDARTGVKKFRAVSTAQEKVFKSMHQSQPYSKGTTLEFRIAPTITALPTFESDSSLETEELVAGLASDFSRSLQSLAVVHADLKKLATLGSLPISHPNPHTLTVRFAGCDSSAVYALCDELGIQRGIVREDPEWDQEDGDKEVEMALLFPWAPSQAPTEALFEPVVKQKPVPNLDWQDMFSSPKTTSLYARSQHSFSVIHEPVEDDFSNPWQSASYTPSYDALRESDIESNEELAFDMDLTHTDTVRPNDSAAYEGMEGMLRFFEQCEASRA